MLCEKCHGTGEIAWLRSSPNFHESFQGMCPDCLGSGIAYCCDDAGVNPPNTYEEKKRRLLGLKERPKWSG